MPLSLQVSVEPYPIYILFKEEEVPGGWSRDIKAFRQRHQR